MRTNLFRIAPMVAVAAFAGTASAQDIFSNGVSVAGERNAAKNGERSAIFTQSALVAPKGAMGFGIQAVSVRSSLDEGGVDGSATETGMVVSGFYGVTSKLSLGAYVPYARASAELNDTELFNESGMADAGIFARFAAYQSGATRFSLGAEMTLATGDDNFTRDESTFGFSGAMSHSMKQWNLHVSPKVQIVDGLDAGYGLNVAAVRSMSERLSLSGEVLSQFGAAASDDPTDEGDKDIDLAGGLRYRFQRTVLDFGLRYNLASQLDPKPTTVGAYLGFNWAF